MFTVSGFWQLAKLLPVCCMLQLFKRSRCFNADYFGCSLGADEHMTYLALEMRPPVVLDGIVRASRQEFADLGPVIAKLCLLLHQDQILFLCPGSMIDARVKVIYIPADRQNPAIWKGYRPESPLGATIIAAVLHAVMISACGRIADIKLSAFCAVCEVLFVSMQQGPRPRRSWHTQKGSASHQGRHLSRSCLPWRPGRCLAKLFHIFGPCCCTSCTSRASSCRKAQPGEEGVSMMCHAERFAQGSTCRPVLTSAFQCLVVLGMSKVF